MNMKTTINLTLAKLNLYSAEGKTIQRLPLEAHDSHRVTTIERDEEIDLDYVAETNMYFQNPPNHLLKGDLANY
jgi:hypothetical protein